jgi:hypothetical protein
MTGGLMQLAIFGSEDIFLTGSPQITFFKVIYRRHTNFAIESIPQYFIGRLNFDQETISVIEKLGDLMNRIYLEIEIPKADLVKNFSNWKNSRENAKIQFEKIQQLYQLVYDYIGTNVDIAKKLDILLRTNNISIEDIEKTINNHIFTNQLVSQRNKLIDFVSKIDNFDGIDEFNTEFIQEILNGIYQIDIKILADHILKNILHVTKFSLEELAIIKRSKLKNFINKFFYKLMHDFYMKIYNIYLTKQKIYQSFLDGTYTERYKFAWVEELGHSIIDKIEIKIGNQIIDTQTGDWLILYNKIFLREYQVENYYKMIGNVTELINFDNNIKNSYKLYIPLQFWFNRNVGLSLPLIALKYNDIMISVKLKDLSKICYVQDDVNFPDIANMQSIYNINIPNAKLYVDYIYLDSDERKRFAQSTHEYLIEVVQYNDFDDIIGKQYNAHLNFAHPVKFIIWYVQPSFYRDNPTGRTKCQFNNFGVKNDKTGYTMESAYLRINSYNRTDPDMNITYYNYVQPYLYFENSPTDGLNIYSFAIKPTEHQPSGSINLSRIDDFGIVISFTKELIDLINNNIDDSEPKIYLATYVMSYNILRIMSGMAGLAFQNSN